MDNLLDTTSSVSEQDEDLLTLVYQRASIFKIIDLYFMLIVVQAAEMHPMLLQYEDNWATYCIVQAHLKSTAALAGRKASAKLAHDLDDLVQSNPQTRSKTSRVKSK